VLPERDLLSEALELVERAQRNADVQLVRELCADSARRFARRAGRERVPLEQYDVGDPEPSQVEGGGGAQGAATDYDDIRRVSECGRGASRTNASRRWPRLTT
jgi:hypothetical protein